MVVVLEVSLVGSSIVVAALVGLVSVACVGSVVGLEITGATVVASGSVASAAVVVGLVSGIVVDSVMGSVGRVSSCRDVVTSCCSPNESPSANGSGVVVLSLL